MEDEEKKEGGRINLLSIIFLRSSYILLTERKLFLFQNLFLLFCFTVLFDPHVSCTYVRVPMTCVIFNSKLVNLDALSDCL